MSSKEDEQLSPLERRRAEQLRRVNQGRDNAPSQEGMSPLERRRAEQLRRLNESRQRVDMQDARYGQPRARAESSGEVTESGRKIDPVTGRTFGENGRNALFGWADLPGKLHRYLVPEAAIGHAVGELTGVNQDDRLGPIARIATEGWVHPGVEHLARGGTPDTDRALEISDRAFMDYGKAVRGGIDAVSGLAGDAYDTVADMAIVTDAERRAMSPSYTLESRDDEEIRLGDYVFRDGAFVRDPVSGESSSGGASVEASSTKSNAGKPPERITPKAAPGERAKPEREQEMPIQRAGIHQGSQNPFAGSGYGLPEPPEDPFQAQAPPSSPSGVSAAGVHAAPQAPAAPPAPPAAPPAPAAPEPDPIGLVNVGGADPFAGSGYGIPGGAPSGAPFQTFQPPAPPAPGAPPAVAPQQPSSPFAGLPAPTPFQPPADITPAGIHPEAPQQLAPPGSTPIDRQPIESPYVSPPTGFDASANAISQDQVIQQILDRFNTSEQGYDRGSQALNPYQIQSSIVGDPAFNPNPSTGALPAIPQPQTPAGSPGVAPGGVPGAAPAPGAVNPYAPEVSLDPMQQALAGASSFSPELLNQQLQQTRQMAPDSRRGDVLDQMLQMAQAPEGPSAAQLQLDRGLSDSMADNLSMARSGRGGAGQQARALQRAASQNAAAQRDHSLDSALLRADETDRQFNRELSALGQAGNMGAGLDQTLLAQQGIENQLAQNLTAADLQSMGIEADIANAIVSQGLNQRGQDVTARGQDLSTLAQVQGNQLQSDTQLKLAEIQDQYNRQFQLTPEQQLLWSAARAGGNSIQSIISWLTG